MMKGNILFEKGCLRHLRAPARTSVCVCVRVLVASIFKVNDDKREGGVCVVCSIRASDLVRVL